MGIDKCFVTSLHNSTAKQITVMIAGLDDEFIKHVVFQPRNLYRRFFRVQSTRSQTTQGRRQVFVAIVRAVPEHAVAFDGSWIFRGWIPPDQHVIVEDLFELNVLWWTCWKGN